MIKCLLAANFFAILGLTMAILFGADTGLRPQQAQAAPNEPAANPVERQPKVAIFNMAAVMKEYKKVRYQIYMFNEERKKRSVDLVDMRRQLADLQNRSKYQLDPADKENIETRQCELTRKLEDKERDNNKTINLKSMRLSPRYTMKSS